MKRITSLFVALLSFMAVWSHPNWKMHVNFDEKVNRVIATPKYIYFACDVQPLTEHYPSYQSIWRYDRENDEYQPLSTDNLLSSIPVCNVEYSPEKEMLVAVYADGDVDLIYDNGKVEHIPDFKNATINYDKKVNSIFIDAEKDRVYLSTDFGYVALNIRKKEIAESRIYGVPVKSMARIGDVLAVLSEEKLFWKEASAPRLAIADYDGGKQFTQTFGMKKLNDSSLLMWSREQGTTISTVDFTEDGVTSKPVIFASISNMEYNRNGVIVGASDALYQFYKDGHYDRINRSPEDERLAAGFDNYSEIWFADKRKGFKSKRYDSNSGTWTTTRNYMAPDAPSPFMASEMVWHPQRGLLVANIGFGHNFPWTDVMSPILLSAYKDGHWTNLSPAYTNPDATPTLYTPSGLAIDPDNQNLVYFGSVMYGMERINMADGSDVVHLSRKSDPYKDEAGFVEIVPDLKGGTGSSSRLASFNAPVIDYYGNLWTIWNDADPDHQNPNYTPLFCWEAPDRRGSVDAERYRPMKQLDIKGYKPQNQGFLLPLMKAGHRNLLLFTNGEYNGWIVMVDTNGTPSDQSDDTVHSITRFTDQDGNAVDVVNIRCMYEDPSTGYVWVGHENGVFYFNPDNLIAGNKQVTRLKIARNDGTNLADYLLDLVPVNKITADGRGRKWFATTGAGVLCTSSDGRTIEENITTSDSPLPDDDVFGIGYIPTTNSLMLSTARGLAEYYLSGSSSVSEIGEVRAYPNPVRPDYYGYVTIDGLPNGALVKIMDASGNIVKELDTVQNGETKWDVTDQAFRRVGSGVYFILSSTDENGGNLSSVGKVMVIN